MTCSDTVGLSQNSGRDIRGLRHTKETAMWKSFIAWLDRDVAVQHLASLDDRMLDDIGVQRDGLRARVMGTAAAAPAPDRDDIDHELCVALATRF